MQDEEDDTPTVTFPDDYPNSVRHFLLIGFLGMFIGAIVFFYMGISRKVNTVMHVLTFFIAAVSACAYYAEWAGLGVEYKTTDTTPRVIFWAHYLDWVITGPVSSICPCHLFSPLTCAQPWWLGIDSELAGESASIFSLAGALWTAPNGAAGIGHGAGCGGRRTRRAAGVGPHVSRLWLDQNRNVPQHTGDVRTKTVGVGGGRACAHVRAGGDGLQSAYRRRDLAVSLGCTDQRKVRSDSTSGRAWHGLCDPHAWLVRPDTSGSM